VTCAAVSSQAVVLIVTTGLEKEIHRSAEGRPGGGIAVKLPFGLSAAWGGSERYDVTGNINGNKVRGKRTSRATVVISAEIVVVLAPEALAERRVEQHGHHPPG